MKTAAYVLQEEQIEWLKRKADDTGQSTASSVLRRILSEAMEREGVNPAFMNITAGNNTPANPEI